MDKLAKIFQNKLDFKYFLINGGGDIYVTSNYDQEVEIFLQNPLDPNEIFQVIKLKDSSICGSSPHLRKWKDKNGEEYNHIINPRSLIHNSKSQNLNLNSRNEKSSFVIARNTVIADVLATTLIIRNDEDFVVELRNNFDFGFITIG